MHHGATARPNTIPAPAHGGALVHIRRLSPARTDIAARQCAMPELPEVETTRRGLAPHLDGRRVTGVTLRRPDLRWPIPPEIAALLPGQRIDAVRRRAKYLLLDTDAGSALLHLGMSGSLRVLPAGTPVTRARPRRPRRWTRARVLRFNDPRRFGCLLWQPPGETHELLRGARPGAAVGRLRRRLPVRSAAAAASAPVKTFLMDQAIVVGVGNIYAAESLFRAGISPLRAAGTVSRERYAPAGRGGEGHPGPRHHPRRHHPARLHQPRRRARLFRAGTVRLRPRRRALPALRAAAASRPTIGQRATVWCGHCQR